MYITGHTVQAGNKVPGFLLAQAAQAQVTFCCVSGTQKEKSFLRDGLKLQRRSLFKYK